MATVYEQFAYYLAELKKNASAFFAASTVISYLRVVINFAKEKFFSRGTVELWEFFSCLDVRSNSSFARWLRNIQHNV